MEKNMKQKVDKLFFISCCYSFFINGLLVLMTGSILTYLMTDYNLTYNQVGLLVSAQAIGNLTAVLLSGVIVNLLGRKKALMAIGVLFAIGFGGIICTSSSILLGILLFLSGAGWGLNANLVNVLVSEATDGHTGYTNILHMSFAIGAFISPLLVSTLTSFDISWKVAVILFAITAISLIFVFMKVPIKEPEGEQKEKVKPSFDFLKDPKYFLYMAIFFCYVGSETALNSWLITYLVQEGVMAIEKAPLMLSALWVTIIFGRMAAAYTSKFIRKDILLAGANLSMFISVGLFLVNKDPRLTIVLIIAIGLSMAGIYPTTVANASYLLTGAGLASGILFAGGGLGASVVPYIVGAIAENKGILEGLISTLGVILIMAILAVVNVILIKKERIS